MKLSILIATVHERAEMLTKLLGKFEGQRSDDIEIVVMSDNKEISIGAKRQKLLERSQGDWVVFFDDDDDPYPKYIKNILQAIYEAEKVGADCIGINGVMTTNGINPQTWCHRLGEIWEGPHTKRCRQKGFTYLRPIIHFNPVKREKALQAGFKDMRFGEDQDYSNRLNKLLKKEVYIKEPLFHYRYVQSDHKKKYGI
jgi:cellulose synthase/poly-beta-1,6-N-acetylglucosamine synthase-like glycosyltransferase